MTLKTAGTISVACALAVGVGLYFVVSWLSILIGIVTLYGVFFALGSLNDRVQKRGKSKPGKTARSLKKTRNSSGGTSKMSSDAVFGAVTGASLVIGTLLGVWVNYLLDVSSILTYLLGFVAVEFVAIFLVAVFGKPINAGDKQDSQEDRESKAERASALVGAPIEGEMQEIDLIQVERPCEACGERYCLHLIKSGDDESFIRCNACFALGRLGEIADDDPSFLPSALRDTMGEDPETSLVLLREALSWQTLEEVNDADPTLLPDVFRSFFNEDECRDALLVLREMQEHGCAWAGTVAAFFRQYSRSLYVVYPHHSRPDPMKLAHAFSVMLGSVGGMTSKQAEEQLSIFELLLDMYACMESNCIEGLRDYLSSATDEAQENGFALTPLNELDFLLTPFENATVEFAGMKPLFEEKLNALFCVVGQRPRLELLKKKYGALFSAS